AFLTGWGIFGGQPTLNSLSATYYPTDLRSTGIGAALGIGRVGGIIGPLVGGLMLGAHWSNESVFYAAAVPAAIAALSSVLLARAMNGAGEPKAAVLATHRRAAPRRPARVYQFVEAIAVEATALVARSLTTSTIVTIPRRNPAVAICSDESKIVTIPRRASRVVAMACSVAWTIDAPLTSPSPANANVTWTSAPSAAKLSGPTACNTSKDRPQLSGASSVSSSSATVIRNASPSAAT